MINDVHLQDSRRLNLALKENEINFQDILLSCYAAIRSNEPQIRAWTYVIPIEMQSPPKIQGPLFGLCLGVKDIFATLDGPTTMGVDSDTWQGTRGSFDARVISKIREAGGTIIGKNKTAEFAVHEPTDTVNPRNYELIPGTSSSGGAAAVAAGHVSVSIASQTAGSIARPASYCGVIGFKPTYGELPRTGVLKTTESFDTVGLIGNSVSNISAVFDVARIQGLNHPIHLKRASVVPHGVKVLHAIGPVFDNANSATRSTAISLVSRLMGDIEPTNLVNSSHIDFEKLRICHEDIYAKELAYFLRDELNSQNTSKGLRAFGKYGSVMPQKDYNAQLQFLNKQRMNADSDLKNTVIFALSASDSAPRLGAPDLIDANLFWTALGLPQISLPLLVSQSGDPIGLSIVGPRGSDSYLLSLAKQIFPDPIN